MLRKQKDQNGMALGLRMEHAALRRLCHKCCKSHITPILRDPRNAFLLGHGNGTKSHRLQFSYKTGRPAALEHTLPTST
jgi:hypothetical protein